MITYIVGNPGSGKSYFAVYKLWYMFIYKPKPLKGILGKIFKPKLPENKYLYAYTNINEFKFELDERLLKFDYDEVYANLAKLYNSYKIEKKTDKELIELAKEMRLYKVLFVVDEIHNYFKAKEDPVLVWWVTYHRHLYQDLLFITQDLSLVNNEYKRVAEKFYRAIDSSKRLFSKRFKYAYFTSYKMYQSDRVNNFNINLPFNQEVFNLYHSGQDSKSKSVVKFFMVAGLIISLLSVFAFIYVFNTFFAVPDEYATAPSENLTPQASAASTASPKASLPSNASKPDEPIEAAYIYEIVCVADSCRFKGGSGSFPYSYVSFVISSHKPAYFYSTTKNKHYVEYYLVFRSPVLDTIKLASFQNSNKGALNENFQKNPDSNSLRN